MNALILLFVVKRISNHIRTIKEFVLLKKNSVYIKKFFWFFLLPLQVTAQDFSKQEISRWEQQAKQVTIIRDNWGIPHIYGKTDADAVFGLLYAQCEDDFKRVEMNYIEKLGRMAEVKGEEYLQ